jgi:hypothetical protein
MPETQDKDISHDRGTVDESHHGWAPDAPGEGAAKDSAIAGHKKAFEGNETQAESRGGGGQGPDLVPEGTGQSSTRRGEDVAREEGTDAGRYDTGTKGESQRPTGGTTARASTSIDPQEPIDPESPHMPYGDQGG